MKPSFTLTDIVDFGTTGGDHLAGEARFSDGKRYRFVVNREWDYSVNPNVLKPATVTSMARPTKDWQGIERFNHNHIKPVVYAKRVPPIMAVYPEYLAKAKAIKEARDTAEDHRREEEQKAYLMDKTLKDAAPELLEALKPFANLDVQHMVSLGKKPNHPIFGLNSTQFTLGDVLRASAAITKATTVPQSV